LGGAIAVLIIAGCATSHRSEPKSPLPTTVGALAAQIAVDAQRSESSADTKARDDLLAEAMRDARACLALAPQDAACLYGQALALGIAARAHPSEAVGALKSMLSNLAAAEAADPSYDQAGPARVQALVLMRAPGWPLGPGDPAEGLAAARRAASIRPQYPPNFMALGEALARTGDLNGAREAYTRARDTAQALPASPDRDEWLREANDALAGK
jgi:tetratricopeptide (TPR) repeat protein